MANAPVHIESLITIPRDEHHGVLTFDVRPESKCAVTSHITIQKSVCRIGAFNSFSLLTLPTYKITPTRFSKLEHSYAGAAQGL